MKTIKTDLDYLEYLKKHPKFTGCVIDKDGTKRYYKNGLCHREDGPAFEYVNGSKAYYKNGLCHREDGPAFEFPDRYKIYFKNGKFHRENGPAVEYVSGDKSYYLNNNRYSYENWKQEVMKLKLSRVLKKIKSQ